MSEHERKVFLQKAWEDVERTTLALVFNRKLAKGQQVDFTPNPESLNRLGLTFMATVAAVKRLEAMLRASGVPDDTVKDYAERGARMGLAAMSGKKSE